MTSLPSPDRGIPLPVLLSQAGELARELLQRQLASSRLRPRHAHVLLFLEHTGAAGQQDLLERLNVDASVLVGLLNDLEGDGMVKRRRDPADRRRHIVTISEQGRAAVAEVHSSIDRISDALFGSLSDADRGHLHRILVALTSGIPVTPSACER
ncbi:MarR family winged helix-turn-helix transcriptional regulator [Actinoplanes subtropicus]|uniref:MarR family winged helix-turn-helix transcriptional regulator n=1 Tax=Actinoplanes subtropicus TaxID=543632 RepID=UPI0014704C2B|nr:MarR family winged helix-turn-helix transcriptional regulator [Actinoplanes subtropicus]